MHTLLDAKDKRILEILIHNARASVADISRETGIARDTVAYRIEQLEKKGVIDRYLSVIKPEAIGKAFFACVLVKMRPSVKAVLDAYTQHFARIPEVTHLTRTIGQYDYVMFIAVRSARDLDTTLDTIKAVQPEQVDSIDVLNIIEEPKIDDFSGVLKTFEV